MADPTSAAKPAHRVLTDARWGAVACFGVLLVRSYGRLVTPHVWAEDGAYFLPDALRGRPELIFSPIAGYFHVVPRLLSQLAVLFPVAAFPALTYLAWIGLYAVAAGHIVRPAYRVYVPSDSARALVAVALCMVPGLNEMIGTLGNLHWALSMGAWLLALKPPSERLAAWEVGWILAAALSGGECIVLVPLLGYRLWRSGRAMRGDGLALAGIVLLAALNVINRGQQPPGERPGLGFLAEGLWSAVLNYFVYAPVIGPRGTQWIGVHANRNFFTLWAVLLLLAAAAVLVRRRLESDRQLLLGIGAWGAVVALAFLVRPSAAIWLSAHAVPLAAFSHRYSYDLAPAGLLFWIAVLRPGDGHDDALRPRLRQVLGLGFLCTNIALLLVSIGRVGPYTPQTGTWYADAARLETALHDGTPRRVSFAIPPLGGWLFDYDVVDRVNYSPRP